MKLIVGLGNPGDKYVNTRHSAGYLFVRKLQKSKLPSGVSLRLSDSFMNDSGIFVKKLIDENKLDLHNLYIAHDDLDIPLGSFKIQLGKGPKDHNGIKSVEEELGSEDFYRVRIGIENRDPENKISGEVYTLQDFTDTEKKVIDSVINKACQEIIRLLQ